MNCLILFRHVQSELNLENIYTGLTDISLRQNISLAYLEQIFIKLKQENLVKSVRGAKGGYVLESPPEEIKISHIISAVDEEIKTLNCKKESKSRGEKTKCFVDVGF